MSEAGVTQSNQSGTSTAGLCVADTGALLCRACTAHVLERPASAGRRAADVTDHYRICGYHWQGVQQHSALVEVCLSQTSAPRLVQSYSNRGTSWRRRARVSSRTQRRVNVGLVSVSEARKKTSHTRWRRACPDWGPMISSRQGRGRDHWQQQCPFQAVAMGHHFLTECANIWSPPRLVLS